MMTLGRQQQDTWPPLIEAVQQKMNTGVSATSDEVRPLALEWNLNNLLTY
jgi:hypothetical protein